jgi:hypothetical protein
MRARIYQKPRNAMQSGQAGTEQWILEYETDNRARPDPLMGWIGGSSTLSQVRLTFATRDEAIAYADKNGLRYDIELPPVARDRKPKVYADNFRFGRLDNWTH